MSHLLAYLSRMKHIRRWGLMRNAQDENNLEHTCMVAFIAHALALLGNARHGGAWNAERAATLALYHDATEVITGDLPTPIKYFGDEIRTAYKRIEAIAADRLADMAPEDLAGAYRATIQGGAAAPEWALVKAADRIAAYLKCVEEEKTGNLEFRDAREGIARDIEGSPLAEVADFMREFAPSFALSLDEMKAGEGR